jgi:hypothetical protein
MQPMVPRKLDRSSNIQVAAGASDINMIYWLVELLFLTYFLGKGNVMVTVKKKGIILSLLICLLGCNSDQSKTENNLRYFGFAFVDCGWDDPNDNAIKTNYVDEISGFTNAAQMCVYTSDELISRRVEKFNQAGIKAVLNIEAILFDRVKDESTPSGTRVVLHPNAEALWKSFVNLNKRALTLKYIAALYVVDEPVWNGVEKEDFLQAMQIVKTSLPDLPTLVIEAHPVVNKMIVPQSLDWIGFDRYSTREPAQDEAWLKNLETIRAARTRSDQKIVIVASTQWFPHYQIEAGISPADMEAMIYSYYHIAASDPHVIALAGYMWPGGLDDPAQLGARSLPENVQQSFREIGKQIISN